ncbi:GLI pathogenesis related 2 [Phyllostomus discolor]|uniref:Golgi-associated plant pathogenesis-related protein 1 n=1 Tax=Phyllostomus discolor TaxID=89673 RepID=A0A834B5E7_9CHIR|nr:GLI pathogenesis related 2 [Phyllostomus discolor]
MASKQFNNEVLIAHNEYRKQHGVPPLKLCKKLNREAQQYSEALASTRILKHSPESSRGQCGENLAWASYDQTGKEVADRWYSEIKNYNFQQPGFNSGTGFRYTTCCALAFFTPRRAEVVPHNATGAFSRFLAVAPYSLAQAAL